MEPGRVRRWLGRLRHDLVKQAAWRARDLRDAGRTANAADLAALRRGLLELCDDEGRPATALAVWRALREELEDEGGIGASEREALDDFELAVTEAEAAARALVCQGGQDERSGAVTATASAEPDAVDICARSLALETALAVLAARLSTGR